MIFSLFQATIQALQHKKLRKIARLLLIVITPLLIVLIWLLYSQSGLNFALNQSRAYLPSELSFKNIQGSIMGPITISELNYSHEDFTIDIKQINVYWSAFDLLQKKLSIDSLRAKSVEISVANSDSKAKKKLNKSTASIVLPNISLPIDIVLNSTEIENIIIINSGLNSDTNSGQQFVINSLSLHGNVISNVNTKSKTSIVNIRSLDINSNKTWISITGSISIADNYNHDLKLRWSKSLNSQNINSQNIKSNSSITGSGRILGDVTKTTVTQKISGAGNLELSATIKNILSHLHWSTNINLNNFNLSHIDKEWPEIKSQLQLHAEGDLNTATLTGHAEYNFPHYGKYSSKFNIQRRNNNHIQIEQFTLIKLHDKSHAETEATSTPQRYASK